MDYELPWTRESPRVRGNTMLQPVPAGGGGGVGVSTWPAPAWAGPAPAAMGSPAVGWGNAQYPAPPGMMLGYVPVASGPPAQVPPGLAPPGAPAPQGQVTDQLVAGYLGPTMESGVPLGHWPSGTPLPPESVSVYGHVMGPGLGPPGAPGWYATVPGPGGGLFPAGVLPQSPAPTSGMGAAELGGSSWMRPGVEIDKGLTPPPSTPHGLQWRTQPDRPGKFLLVAVDERGELVPPPPAGLRLVSTSSLSGADAARRGGFIRDARCDL